MHAPPTKINVNKSDKSVELVFNNISYLLSFEFLRVYSPSAEVRGHGKGQEVLQLNKEAVMITNAAMQGNYAIKFIFDDGHDSGVYTWDYLYELATNKEALWQTYQDKVEMHQSGQSAVKWVP